MEMFVVGEVSKKTVHDQEICNRRVEDVGFQEDDLEAVRQLQLCRQVFVWNDYECLWAIWVGE